MIFYNNDCKRYSSSKRDSSKGEYNGQKQILGNSPQGPYIL